MAQGGVLQPGTTTNNAYTVAGANAPASQVLRQAPVSVVNQTTTIDARTTLDFKGARVDQQSWPAIRREMTRMLEQRENKLAQMLDQGVGAR
jgi:hypothetical protein